MRNIDVHSHILPFEAIKSLGGQVVSLGEDLYDVRILGKSISPMTKGFFDPQSRNSELAKLGIDAQVLSPTHHLFFYDDLEAAKKLSRIQNEGIASVVKTQPDRYLGNCTLPMQSPKDAVAELEHAYSDLDLNGVEIGTNVAGANLDDESLFPVYEKAQELGLPIFVHPNDMMGGKRLQKYYMSIVVGTIVETTVAVTSLFFGGVLKKFPKLKMIFCHGGGAIPYQIGRLEHAAKTREEVKQLGISIREMMNNIYFDTVIFNNDSLALLLKVMGDSNVLFGTDYPFNMGQWDSAKMITENKALTESSKRKILYENAEKLYKLMKQN